jgi:hypothetical protein
MNCLRSLENLDCRFDSHSRYGRVSLFMLCLQCPVCSLRPCVGLIPRQKSPTDCIIIIIILTVNGFLPGGSRNTIKHNKHITHITQNNTTIKRNTSHKTTHTIKDTTQNEYKQSQLQTNSHNYKQTITNTNKQ